jgi:hypothetical protein
MDELGQRLERFAREGTTTTVPPGISHIRRRGHRRRQRQITGMLLGAALLTGLVLGPGRNLTRWIDNASPTAPVTRPLPESRDDRRAPVDPLIEEQGRPIPPIVVVASGVFEGKRWEYLAYRTNRGKVCGQWNRPDQVEHIRRLAPSLVIEVGGRRLVPGGGCGFTFGTTGFRNSNRIATDFEASLPASYARVRVELDAGPPMVLSPAGRKQLGRGFIAIRLPDLRTIRDMIAYDEQGHVIYHGKAHFTFRGLDFTPVRSK